ncbi:MAG: hypothetical protein SFX74_09615, partial [Fimbriimonadaceae bacterium]|nr:hypothetical protein [Fimbriimonadaceae bacterium]
GDVAHDALKSLIARDVNGLTNAVCEADYDDTGMTKEQARQAIQHVIVPIASDFQASGKLDTREDPQGNWGISFVNGVAAGRPRNLGISTTLSENGPCVSFFDLLRMKWITESNRPRSLNDEYQGLLRDRPQLERFGITKIIHSNGSVLTLDQLEQQFRDGANSTR